MNENFDILKSFKASTENFYSLSKIFDKDLKPNYLFEIFNYLSPTKNENYKFSPIQLHYGVTLNYIAFDFMKSVQHLCQGFFADHYFYLRRSIEYFQLYAFMQSSDDPNMTFKLYTETKTHQFKNIDKQFQKWLNSERKNLKKNYSWLMRAYKDACDYGSHAGLDNQSITQSWNTYESKPDINICIQFFDLGNDQFEKAPFVPALIQVFRVYMDILHGTYQFKLTPKPWPEDKFSKLHYEFNKFFYRFREDLITNYPEYVESIFEEFSKK